MDRTDVAESAAAIAALLERIDAGEVAATDDERLKARGIARGARRGLAVRSIAMPDAENPAVIQGLAAVAISGTDRGLSDDEVCVEVLSAAVQMGVEDLEIADVMRSTAAMIGRMPQPLEETADDTERRRHIREVLGVPDASDELASMLRAREIVEELAKRFG